jgi:hypothetical protein
VGLDSLQQLLIYDQTQKLSSNKATAYSSKINLSATGASVYSFRKGGKLR